MLHGEVGAGWVTCCRGSVRLLLCRLQVCVGTWPLTALGMPVTRHFGIIQSMFSSRLPLHPCRLTAIGVGIGLAFAWATTYVLKLLRWRGVQPYVEAITTLTLAYLAFYVAQSPAEVSYC